MHENCIYHFDVKPRNMIAIQGTIIIIDFGLSKIFSNKNKIKIRY